MPPDVVVSLFMLVMAQAGIIIFKDMREVIIIIARLGRAGVIPTVAGNLGVVTIMMGISHSIGDITIVLLRMRNYEDSRIEIGNINYTS